MYFNEEDRLNRLKGFFEDDTDDFEESDTEFEEYDDELDEPDPFEEDETLKALLEYIKKHLPKTVYLTKNKGRYEEILHDIDELISFVTKEDKEVTYKVYTDELLGCCLNLEFECTIFSVSDMKKFGELIKKANTFEVCAKTNGELYLAFTFEDAFVPYDPDK